MPRTFARTGSFARKGKKIFCAGLALLLFFFPILEPFRAERAFAADLLDGAYSAGAVVEDYMDGMPPYTVGVTLDIAGGVIAGLSYTAEMDPIDWEDNGYYVEDAFAGLQSYALGRSDIDGIDAVSGATYASEAFISAARQALRAAQANPGQSLEAPRISPADRRSAYYFSAAAGAAFAVANDNDGAETLYTLDGSSPAEPGNASAMAAEGGMIVIPGGLYSQGATITLSYAAVRDGAASSVQTARLVFLADAGAGGAEPGTKIYRASGYCSFGYDVALIVTTVNGAITAIEDDLTMPGEANRQYWDAASAMLARDGAHSLYGKTAAGVAELRTSPTGDAGQKVDAVSGATVVSNAIKYAVVEALAGGQPWQSSDNELAAPYMPAGGRYFVFGSDLPQAVISAQAPVGAEVFYAVGGPGGASADPYADGQKAENGAIEISNGAEPPSAGTIVSLSVGAYAGEPPEQRKSDILRRHVIFAPPSQSAAYATGVYYRAANPGRELDARVVVADGMIRDIRIIPYGQLSDAALERIAAELIPAMLLAQSAQVAPLAGLEAESALAIGAVQYHLDNGAAAEKPEAEAPAFEVADRRELYGNGEQVTVALGSGTSGADIYYTVDYSLPGETGGFLSDPADPGSARILYGGPFAVGAPGAAGGVAHVNAVAVSGATAYSPVSRMDFAFAPAIPAGAILANGVPCDTFEQAVAIINAAEGAGGSEGGSGGEEGAGGSEGAAGGGVIVLGCDVALSAETLLAGMPVRPCLIEAGGLYALRGGATPLVANADLSFGGIILDVSAIYGNGHRIAIESGVETPYSFYGPAIYGGAPYVEGDPGGNALAADASVLIKSGRFDVYAGGGIGTTLDGSAAIRVEGGAAVSIAGAGFGSAISGDVSVEVRGDSATLSGFVGEQSAGAIGGALSLSIYGNPALDPHGEYIGSASRAFGTVSLYRSDIDEALFGSFSGVASYDEEPGEP
ncbi:MAG: FMN-binding protein, partial [Clostridiales bacterium]|nr:FMN-binding protein [Clostridiales bacterium]